MSPQVQAWIEQRKTKEPLVFQTSEFVHGRNHAETAANVALISGSNAELFPSIKQVWEQLSYDDPIGYVSYDAVSKKTGLSVLQIVQALRTQPAEKVRFGINRMGHNTQFKLV